MKKFEIKTPAAKKSRMNWSIENMNAEVPANIDVQNTQKGEPYFKFDMTGYGSVIAVKVAQFLADTETSAVKLIISKEGDPIEINEDVKIGVKDGVFFTI